MKLKIKIEDQMAAPPLKNSLKLWFISLTFFLLPLGFLGFSRFSSFLITFSLLIMSMVFITISKRNPLLVEEDEEETLISDKKLSSVSVPTTESPDNMSSESECGDTTTEEESEVEVEWPFSTQNLDCSDGSISDEESLIEIALPTGHYVCQNEEETFYFQKQKRVMELLAEINEINEEENLIEIDISMGSIK